jgi:hypothetical protein
MQMMTDGVCPDPNQDQNPDTLYEITRWYVSKCNKVWEHRYGITIESADNPGWVIKIDLIGTELEGRHFDKIDIGTHSGTYWISAEVENGIFRAGCSPLQINFVLGIFLKWSK